MKQGIWMQEHIGNPIFDGLTLGGILEVGDLPGGVFWKTDYPGLRAIRDTDGSMILARDLTAPYTPPGVAAGGGNPAGMVADHAGATVPDGWLLCDGAAISRTEYAALFDALGTAHGAGDGSTTFNLPDLRDRFIAGAGSTYTLAATGGAATVALTTANLSSHTHDNGTLATASGGVHSHTLLQRITSGTSTDRLNKLTGTAGTQSNSDAIQDSSSHTHTITGATAAAGSGTAHENRPPYYALTKIVFAGVGAAAGLLELWY
jgi:microcystin-dependent protein